ncbi:hypothetical protein Glove_368g11 [Diversispora epigaea]|uniref:Uncharacterized protein n=1 Tax=Diversispora epigaea TaxID=1348612 RepID=A0A397H7W1_9GLOM|nr:hypothetical protein Glove_368g11 [Diversispora epigaea]
MSSEPASPSSISSSEEVITRTMADVIEDYDSDELINYLRRRNLKLDEDDFNRNYVLLTLRNIMIVNQSLLIQALEQANSHPPRNSQQSPTVTSLLRN